MREGEGMVRENSDRIREIWGFLMTSKKWWLYPIIIILFVLGVVIVFAETSAVAPLIYTLF